MKTLRGILWLFVGMILLWTTVAQADDLEIVTSPLPGPHTTCMVTNVSTNPVDVTIEVIDGRGNFIGSAGNPGLLPLWTIATSTSNTILGVFTSTIRICRVTSADGKKDDLRVTLCTSSEQNGRCTLAVTAE